MHSLQTIRDNVKVRTLTKAILLTLGAGTILAAALVAPNAVQILKPFLGRGKRRNYEQERIRQALRALVQRRLVEYIERDQKAYIKVSDAGRKYMRQFEVESIAFPHSKWDGKWRLVLFDIPERQGAARRAFQRQLKALGCFPLQKSIFVYPYSCQDEVDFLASFWDVYPYVRFLETADLGRSEGEARKFFGLLT